MLKILVPIDGSSSAMNALRHVVLPRQHGLDVEIHLLTVQSPLAFGHAKMFVHNEDFNRYCRRRR